MCLSNFLLRVGRQLLGTSLRFGHYRPGLPRGVDRNPC